MLNLCPDSISLYNYSIQQAYIKSMEYGLALIAQKKFHMQTVKAFKFIAFFILNSSLVLICNPSFLKIIHLPLVHRYYPVGRWAANKFDKIIK